jgi:UDP-N-acetylmuramate dehydrogenase
VPLLSIREAVPLAPLTTFGIGGPAHAFASITSEAQIPEALDYAAARSLPVFILGGGSNLLVPDTGYPGLIVHMQIPGIEGLGSGLFAAGAGVPWDDLAADCAGLECLAGIPGTTGGTPVQNVGAYGQEVAQTITTVRAFDRQTLAFIDLPAVACNFRYRASLFNTDQRNRYIVTRVTFQLHLQGSPTLKYADLARHFAGQPKPSLTEVAAAVREIRHSKGMLLVAGDPDTRSAGSYFKNPIVPRSTLEQIARAAGLPIDKIPHWPVENHLVKLPAAWLLEQSGFLKGYGEGRAGISTRHTLAVINRGRATFADLEYLESEIRAGVQKKFAITLEREPVLLT